MLFLFARIPLFSRKMISFAYIPANPRCQMPTDRGSGFQGTQIGGTRLQNRELRTFPICHFLKIDTLSSGSGRRARPRCSAGLALGQERGEGSCREWWDVCRAVLRAGGTQNRISGCPGLCASCLGTEPQGQMGTGGSSSGAVAECPVRCRGHRARLGTCRQRLSPVLCHCRRFLRVGRAFWPPPRGRQAGREALQ